MATLCNPYGTSPISSFFNELAHNEFSDELTAHDLSDDFFQIQPDPFDMFDNLPSIYSDIQKIKSDPFSLQGSGADCDLDMKTEVRNTDLMWWTAPTTGRIPASPSSSFSDFSTGVPLAVVMGYANSPQKNTPQNKVEKEELPTHTIVTAKKVNSMTFKQEIVNIKNEPADDVEKQLTYNSIPKSQKISTTSITPTIQQHVILQAAGLPTTSTSMQNIPAGTSLLRKSQQQRKSQQMRSPVRLSKRNDYLLPSSNDIFANTVSSDFASNTSISTNTSILCQRPDTPHSLDDDCSISEFKHNVDLRACVMGSNSICLPTDQDFIRNVSQELQDMSKKQIDTRMISGCSLSDVLDVISNSSNEEDFLNHNSPPPILHSSSTSPSEFDYQSTNSNVSNRPSESESDEDSLMASRSSSVLNHDTTFNTGGVSPVSSQFLNVAGTQNYMQHRDHSYTRCKDGMDELSTNLETPSDSEEEIDVVSLNDRKLPTNPTDKDRRALQTKVAHRFSSARIVKTPNGIRTLLPRRCSYELPCTPASNSPIKSVSNSAFPSPSSTPYQHQYTTKSGQQQQQLISVVNDSLTVGPINVFDSTDKSRKRLINSVDRSSNLSYNSDLNASISSANNMVSCKRHRSKKTKLVPAVQLPNSILKRECSVDDIADTIEKRNLHNDMERQRRIGLKNLFEALKKQIPSIKDKERAPKVNILREAAKLCEQLTREDKQLTEQKAKFKEQLRRRQDLLAKLRSVHKTD